MCFAQYGYGLEYLFLTDGLDMILAETDSK